MAVRSTLELDTSPYKKGMKEVEQVSEQTAKKQSGTWGKEGKKAGEQSAQEMVKGMQAKLRSQQAQLKERFARGAISKAEFQKKGKEAAAAFNKEVLAALDALQKKGKISQEELTKLGGSLKTTGIAAEAAGKKGKKAGGMIAKGFKVAKLAVAAVAAVFVGSKIAQFFGNATRNAVELGKSYLKLSAGAKLFGVSQKELNALAQHGVKNLQLTNREANELAVTSAKLTAQANQRAKSQDLLNRAMDLGSAQGLDATEINLALDQALRGIDEGTDKLLQKNPSAIYEEYAASLGTTAGKLTDVQKKQSIVNAVIEAGTRVGGAYEEFLDSDIGKLSLWDRGMQAASERIGSALIPILADLAGFMKGPLETATDVLVSFLQNVQILAVSSAVRIQELKIGMMELARAANEMPVVGWVIPDGVIPTDQEMGAARSYLRALETAAEQESVRIMNSGSGTPGGSGSGYTPPGSDGGGSASPIVLSNLERLEFAMGKVEDAEKRLKTARRENKAEDAAEATQALAEAQRDLDAAIRDTTAAVQASGVTLDPVKILPFDPEQARIAEEALKTIKEDVGLLLSSGYKPLSLALGEVERKVNLVAQAEMNLRDVRLSGGGPDDIRAAEEALAAQKEELRSRIADVAQALKDAGIEGERFRKIMDQLAEASGKGGLDLDGQTKDWKGWASTVEGLARGVLSVADAMGVLDDESRKALQGVIDVAAGVGRIASGDLVGGIAQAVGGTINLISGLRGNDEAEKKARLDQIEAMADLRKALKSLEGAVLSNMSAQARDTLLGTGKDVLSRYGYHDGKVTRPSIEDLSPEELDRLQELSEITGVDFLDFEKGVINLRLLGEAVRAFEGQELGIFPDTIDGKIDAMAFKWRLLGDAAGDAAQKFDEFLEVIGQVEGGGPFADALKRALEEGGPEAANALIDSWAERFANGDQSLFAEGGVFHGLTGEEVRELLQSGNDLIEEWINSGGGTSQSVQIGRSITEVQAVEVVAWLQDIAFTLREMHALMRLSQGLVSNTAALGAAMTSQPSALSQAYAQLQSGSGGKPLIQTGDISVGTDEETLFWSLWAKLGEHTLRKSKEKGL